MSVLAFVPAIFLGIIGGLLGALFVFLNIKINATRMLLFRAIPKTYLRKTAKLLESVLLLVSIKWHYVEISKVIFMLVSARMETNRASNFRNRILRK